MLGMMELLGGGSQTVTDAISSTIMVIGMASDDTLRASRGNRGQRTKALLNTLR
jgi:hypothetical protein